MRRAYRQLLERCKRPHFESGQSDGLFAGEADGNCLPRAGADHGERLEIGGLQRQCSTFVLEQNSRINGCLLNDLCVLGVVRWCDFELVLAIEEAEAVHLEEDSARGARNGVFGDCAGGDELLQIGCRPRLMRGLPGLLRGFFGQSGARSRSVPLLPRFVIRALRFGLFI